MASNGNYVVFSNELAVDEIIKKMGFLRIQPFVSDKIYIKDENGNVVKNKNGKPLYFYNLEYEIKLSNGSIHKIKLSILTNSMLPASKNADAIDVILYLNIGNRAEVKRLFPAELILNVLGTNVKYNEFTTEQTYGTLQFKVKNPNGKKAFEYINDIITKINQLVMKNFPTIAETLGRSEVLVEAKPVLAEAKPVLAEAKPVLAEAKPVLAEAKPVVASKVTEVAQPAPATAEIESTESDLSIKFRQLEDEKKKYSELKKQKKENEAKIAIIKAKRAQLDQEEAESNKNIDLYNSEMKLSEKKIESINDDLSSALKSNSWLD